MANQWNKVTESVPKQGIVVVVKLSNNFLTEGYRNTLGQWVIEAKDGSFEEEAIEFVTHWRLKLKL